MKLAIFALCYCSILQVNHIQEERDEITSTPLVWIPKSEYLGEVGINNN